MSLQLWLFTLIKSELWGISLSPISVFLFPPSSQLPPFLPSFPFSSSASFFSPPLFFWFIVTDDWDEAAGCLQALSDRSTQSHLSLPPSITSHISLSRSSFFSLFLFSSPSERGENRGERCQGQAAVLHRAAVSVSEHTRQKTYAHLTGSDLTIFISVSSELP